MTVATSPSRVLPRYLLVWIIVSTAAVVVGASQEAPGQVVSTMHAPRSSKQTPGTELAVEELKREKGNRGTRITYGITTSGFPVDKTYTLLVSSLAAPKRAVVLSGITVEPSGRLGSGRTADGQTVELSKLAPAVDDYNKGEVLRFEVVSDDSAVYAVDQLFPFPIVARDGACELWATLITKDRKNFGIMGRGFGADTDVRTSSSEDGGKDVREATTRVGANDLFAAAVQHRRSGGAASFTASGRGCQVTLRYDFGRQAKGPQ